MATLNSNALTTLDALKTELKITVNTFDDYLKTLINAASATICRRCNRDFYYKDALVENLAGYNSVRLRVRQTPIDTTKTLTVTFNGQAVDATYFVEDANVGFIYNQFGWSWTAPRMANVQSDPLPGQENPAYAVTYSGGYYTPQQMATISPTPTPTDAQLLPADLERACIMLCVWMYRQQGQDGTVTSERLLSYSVAYKTDSKIPFVEDVITRYKRIGVSR